MGSGGEGPVGSGEEGPVGSGERWGKFTWFTVECVLILTTVRLHFGFWILGVHFVSDCIILSLSNSRHQTWYYT